MSSINLSTGLPDLPPDLIWRVKERQPAWYKSYQESCVLVEIVQKIEKQVPRPREILGMQFGYHKDLMTVHSENVVAEQVVWHPDREIMEGFDGWAVKLRDGAMYIPAKPSEITASMVLEAAKEALAWYEAKQEADKLFGEYPPKQLVVENA